MGASMRGDLDILKLLVDNGGDINVRDNVSEMIIMILSVTPLPVHQKLYVTDICLESYYFLFFIYFL